MDMPPLAHSFPNLPQACVVVRLTVGLLVAAAPACGNLPQSRHEPRAQPRQLALLRSLLSL